MASSDTTPTPFHFHHQGRELNLIPGEPLLYYALNKTPSPGPPYPKPPKGDSPPPTSPDEEPDWLDPPDFTNPKGYIDDEGKGHGSIDYGWALEGIPTFNGERERNLSEESRALVQAVLKVNEGLGVVNFGSSGIWAGLMGVINTDCPCFPHVCGGEGKGDIKTSSSGQEADSEARLGLDVVRPVKDPGEEQE
ncbi:hypothetical protein I302_102954 [Kwoniella bestiolae CBS 10118]|uniref:Uncharacterized protein n=1 Tax=Kwoniella bestiolae CBS 10118 TaxID=1296100 RepID=A0A1B9GGQ4_9TREE|nr:hypothetical protein I302_01650 [Kwoniella bestiolae CBS 10118]OCF30131.1 hypothetical protein I302_01650 [Kwoniella bestiolae CBS 10118]